MRKGRRLFIFVWVLGFSVLLAACQGGNGSGSAQEGGKAGEHNAAEESGKNREDNTAEEDGKMQEAARTQDGSGNQDAGEEDSKVRGSREKEDAGEGTEDADDFPGEYTVPEGWVKAEKYSTANQIFYVEEGHEEDGRPDNISISIGTNRYSADEHEEFREAILRQIMMQIGKQPGVQLYGDGTHTEQGYVVYIFTIEEEQEGIVTKQYYIVGDRRFCLIHLTNFTGSESVDEAARAMADSFVWKE